jgi:hypothetical protein
MENLMIYFTHHKSLKYLFAQKEFNLRQRQWLEPIKDYDLSIQYNLVKGNLILDTISRKPVRTTIDCLGITLNRWISFIVLLASSLS